MLSAVDGWRHASKFETELFLLRCAAGIVLAFTLANLQQFWRRKDRQWLDRAIAILKWQKS